MITELVIAPLSSDLAPLLLLGLDLAPLLLVGFDLAQATVLVAIETVHHSAAD